ncbi:MAG: hypothetical protein ACPW61_09010 [Methyloligella sp. ZOD6]
MDDDAKFDELSASIGRIFLAFAHLESGLNATIWAIQERYPDPDRDVDPPRALSKKTEFIRRFFKAHTGWNFMSDAVHGTMKDVDTLAEYRNALAHGQIVDVPAALDGKDFDILLHKQKKGKQVFYKCHVEQDSLADVGYHTLALATFIARLCEIIRGELEDDRLENLMRSFVSERR